LAYVPALPNGETKMAPSAAPGSSVVTVTGGGGRVASAWVAEFSAAVAVEASATVAGVMTRIAVSAEAARTVARVGVLMGVEVLSEIVK
jgi:hypothetical protein